jgi:hypothetical protein
MEQRMAALDRAQEANLARFEVLKAVREGRITLAAAALDPRLDSIEVGKLLRERRGWGRKTILRTLQTLQLREQKRLGELTERQRRLLVLEVQR